MGEETVKAKKAFGHFALRHHTQVKHCHCVSATLSGKTFRAAVEEANQIITFCGINAH
jgi:hypothetical protein